MIVNDSRYNITNYSYQNEGGALRQLEQKYSALLQSKFSDKTFLSEINQKLVAALFLDKIPKTSGATHPDTLFVSQYGFSSSTAASLQLISYLTDIRNDARLPLDAREAIDSWIRSEREYLIIPLIFDGWRSANPHTMGIVGSTVTSPAKDLTVFSVTPPQEEVDIVANALAQHFKNMVPGQHYKMLAGFNIHETRLHFEKMSDGTFTLHHYDTAEEYATVKKREKIPSEQLENPTCWKELIQAKMTSSDMKVVHSWLSKLGNPSTLLIDELLIAKSKQQLNSCPVQAAEADFKHHMIRSAKDPDEGLLHYKLVKSLMEERALIQEKNVIHPKLYSLLESKEKVKHRYLFWLNISNDPELFKRAKEAYFEMIAMLNPHSRLEMENAIHGHSPVMTLRILDNRLDKLLDQTASENAHAVLHRHAELFNPQDSPILCLKYRQRTEKVKERVRQASENALSLTGRSLKFLRNATASFLPERLSKALDAYVKTQEITASDLNDFIQYESLRHSIPVLSELFSNGVIDHNTLYDVIKMQLYRQNKPTVIALANLLLLSDKLSTIQLTTCLAAVRPSICIEKAKLSISSFGPRTTDIFNRDIVQILSVLVLCDHREQAVELLNNYMETFAYQPMSSLLFYFQTAHDNMKEWIINYYLDHINASSNDNKDAITTILFFRMSAEQEMQFFDNLIKKVGPFNTYKLVLATSSSSAPMRLATLKYLALQRQIVPLLFLPSFIKFESDNAQKWLEDIKDLHAHGMPVTKPLINTVVEQTLNYRRVRKAILEYYLQQKDLSPQLRWYCLALKDPKELLKQVAEKGIDIFFNVEVTSIMSTLSPEQILRLAPYAFRQPDDEPTLISCFYHIYLFETAKVPELFHQFIQSYGKDEDSKVKVERFIKNSTFASVIYPKFAQQIDQELAAHFQQDRQEKPR